MKTLSLSKLLLNFLLLILLFTTAGCLNKDVKEIIERGEPLKIIKGSSSGAGYDFEVNVGQVKKFYATGGSPQYVFSMEDENKQPIEVTQLSSGEFVIPNVSSIITVKVKDAKGAVASAKVKILDPYPQMLGWEGPSTVYEGECAAFKVTSLDHYGNKVPARNTIRVNATGYGSGVFYKDAACTIPAFNQALIQQGYSEKAIYFRDIVLEQLTLIDYGDALDPGSIRVNVVAVKKPDHFRIVDPKDSEVGHATTVTIQVEDEDNNVVPYYPGKVNFHVNGFAYVDNSAGTKVKELTFTDGKAFVDVNDLTSQIVRLSLSRFDDNPPNDIDVSSKQDVWFYGGIPVYMEIVRAFPAMPVPPPAIYAGDNIQIKIRLLDANMQFVNSTALVEMGWEHDASGNTAVLTGSRQKNAVAGIATFDFNIDKVASGYQMKFSSPALDPSEIELSDLFAIIPGEPKKLVFLNDPKNVAGNKIKAGEQIVSVLGANLQVELRDQYGNKCTNDGVNVALSFATGSPTATVYGSVSAQTAVGVATFSDLKIRTANVNYKLKASASVNTTALTIDNTELFDIIHNDPNKLTFTSQPPAETGVLNTMTKVSVALRDQYDNNITSTACAVADISLALNPAAGAVLTGGVIPAVAGLSDFTAITVNQPGTFVFDASHSCLGSSVASSSFKIVTGIPHHFEFVNQPADPTVAGATIQDGSGNSIQVKVVDAGGFLVDTGVGSNTSITLSAINGAGGPLQTATTLTVSAVGGIATFSNQFITLAGANYQLQATGSVPGRPDIILGAAQSAAAGFDVIPANPVSIAFKVQPDEDGNDTVAGVDIAPAVTVEVRDQYGNKTNSNGVEITISLAHDASISANAVLKTTDSLVVNTINGTATFNSLFIEKISKALDEYTLNATATNIVAAPTITNPGKVALSSGFKIIAAGADHLAFVAQPPLQTVSNIAMATFTVQAVDAFGNSVAQSGITATLSFAATGQPVAAVITNATASTNASGVATFSTTSINKAFNGYVFTATGDLAGALPNAAAAAQTSSAFEILGGGPAKVAIDEVLLQSAADATAGVAIRTVTVRVLDGDDNPANATALSGASLALQLVHLNGATGLGTTQIIFDGSTNVATFSNFVVQKADTNYKLKASYNAGTILSVDTTSTFNVTHNIPHHITFTQNPPSSPNAKAKENFTVAVEIRDQYENVVSSSTGNNVTLSLTTNPAGATLSPAAPADTTLLGAASIAGISLDKKGVGYRLTASALVGIYNVSGTSTLFNIDYGNPHHIVIYQQPPVDEDVGVNMNPPIIIEIQDEGNNRVESHAAIQVTLEFVDNNTGASLPADYSGYQVSTTNGLASFSAFTVNVTGLDYTIKALATLPVIGAVETAESEAFDILAGNPAKLAFISTVADATAGKDISGIVVEIQDGAGNKVYRAGETITLIVDSGPGTTIYNLTQTTNANGEAIFNNLAVNSRPQIRLSGVYTLGATATIGGTPINNGMISSNAFTIYTDVAHHLEFANVASPTQVLTDIAPFTVTLHDQYHNVVTANDGANVTLSLKLNPGTATINGTNPRTLSSGIATFDNIDLSMPGTGYQFTATFNAITKDSNLFNIITDPATHLVFTIMPASGANVVAGTNFAVRVEARNASNIVDPTFTCSVVLTSPVAVFNGSTSSTVAAVAGIVNYNVNLHTAGANYTLSANCANPAISGVAATTFNIIPAAANHLHFTSQPQNEVIGGTIEGDANAAVQVAVHDIYENVTTNVSSTIVMSLANDPNAPGSPSTLSTTLNATTGSTGVASFNNLQINKSGIGFTLRATISSTAITTTSSAFNIFTEPASKFVIIEPTDVYVTQNATILVEAQTSTGLKDFAFSGTVTLIADGFSTGEGLVTITNGSGIITITDTIIETVNLSLSNGTEDGTGRVLTTTDVKDVDFMEPPDCTASDAIGTACGGGWKASATHVISLADATYMYGGYNFSGDPADDVNGLANTQTLYSHGHHNAANYCYDLVATGVFRNWYLPARGEFVGADGVFNSLVSAGKTAAVGLVTTNGVYYWSSTNNTNYTARQVNVTDAASTYRYERKDTSYKVRCIRPFGNANIESIQFQPIASAVYGEVTLQLRAIDSDGGLYTNFEGDVTLEQNPTALNITGLGVVHFSGGIGYATINVTEPGDVTIAMDSTPLAYDGYRVDTSDTISFTVAGEVETLTASTMAPTANDIHLEWGPTVAGEEDEYIISYAAGSAPPVNCTGGATISASSATDYDVFGLAGLTTYYFRVCWKNIANNTTSTGALVIKTTPEAECLSTDPAGKICSGGIKFMTGWVVARDSASPTAIHYGGAYSFSAATAHCDTLVSNGRSDWIVAGGSNPNPSNTNHFASLLLNRGVLGLVSTNHSHWTSDNASGSLRYYASWITTSSTFSEYTQNVSYVYTVMCVRNYGQTSDVQNLTITANNPTPKDILIDWDASGDGVEDNYIVAYQTGGFPAAQCGGGTTISTAATNYTLNNLSSSTTYYVRVCLFDANTGYTSSGKTATITMPNYSEIDCTVPGNQIIDYLGAIKYVIMGNNCNSVTIKAWGAGGGGAIDDYDGTITNVDGGAGGFASLTQNVLLGDVLQLRVGGRGNYGSGSAVYGWPNGGNGIDYGDCAVGCWSGVTGGGGGSTSVTLSGAVILEAGGGGGATAFGAGVAGGGIGACVPAGIQNGANAMDFLDGDEAGGGGGYCGGAINGAGTSYFSPGGLQTAGSGTTPGNAADPDRGTAGNKDTNGRLIISW